MIAKFLPYLKSHRWRVGLALAQVFLVAAFELLKPWPLQIVIDYVLGGKTPPVGRPGRRSAEPAAADLLLLACVGIVLVHFGAGALTLWHNYTTIRVGQAMVNDLRGDLYAHLQRLSLGYHGRQRVGDLMYRITADSFAVQTMIMNGLLPILSALVLLGRHADRAVPDRSAADRAGADDRAGAVRADRRVQPQDRRRRDRGARSRKPGLFAGAMGHVGDQGRAGFYERGRRAPPLHGRQPRKPARHAASLQLADLVFGGGQCRCRGRHGGRRVRRRARRAVRAI